MELNERIAAVRKAAGLTQEALGARLGVTRQAVSKWENGSATPDAVTLARLCTELHVSADYILLGVEPTDPSPEGPGIPFDHKCPCCGADVPETTCPNCGYVSPEFTQPGPRYALIIEYKSFVASHFRDALPLLCSFGFSEETLQEQIQSIESSGTATLVRRDISSGTALWIAAKLNLEFFHTRIVEDFGQPEEQLLRLPGAMPTPKETGNSVGFWAVAAAVVLALVILSFF